MSGIIQDTSLWPLVVVRFTATEATDEDIERFFEEQRRMLACGERYVELVDTANVRFVMNAAQRRKFVEFLKETTDASSRLCIGLSVLVQGSLFRGAMQAVLWLFTPEMPVKMAPSLEACARHCREWMIEHDLPNRERAERHLLSLEQRRAV